MWSGHIGRMKETDQNYSKKTNKKGHESKNYLNKKLFKCNSDPKNPEKSAQKIGKRKKFKPMVWTVGIDGRR